MAVKRFLLLAMLTLAASQAGAADFLASYKAGLAAIEQGDWAEAAVRMREAVADRPEEKARLTHGFYFRRYTPHFFLGKALFRLGDCEGALRSWTVSESQGVIGRFPDHQELRAGRAECLGRMELAEAIGRAEEILTAAQGADDQAREVGSELVQANLPESATLWESLMQAERILAEARAVLEESRQGEDPEGVRRAESLASQALGRFEELANEGRRLEREARLRRAEAQVELETVIAGARQALGSAAFLQPLPPGIRRLVERLEALIAAGEAAGPQIPAARLDDLEANLEAAAEELRRALGRPPGYLTDAAAALFEGRYERVLEILRDAPVAGRAAGYAHLLRAAALHSLYLLGGEEQQDLLGQAVAEVRACRALGPEPRPVAKSFSPRFVAFFQAN